MSGFLLIKNIINNNIIIPDLCNIKGFAIGYIGISSLNSYMNVTK